MTEETMAEEDLSEEKDLTFGELTAKEIERIESWIVTVKSSAAKLADYEKVRGTILAERLMLLAAE